MIASIFFLIADIKKYQNYYLKKKIVVFQVILCYFSSVVYNTIWTHM